MALDKFKHWQTRHFHKFLLARARMPFSWAENDCCTFAADAILSFTGVDIADDFRGKYKDKKTAFRLIKKVTGGDTVADAAAYCATKYGLTELPTPLFAQRGDLVLVEEAGELIAGVVHLNGRHIVVVGEDGLKMKSIKESKKAWRV